MDAPRPRISAGSVLGACRVGGHGPRALWCWRLGAGNSVLMLVTAFICCEGRGAQKLTECRAVAPGDSDAAYAALEDNISRAFETRLRQDSMSEARFSL